MFLSSRSHLCEIRPHCLYGISLVRVYMARTTHHHDVRLPYRFSDLVAISHLDMVGQSRRTLTETGTLILGAGLVVRISSSLDKSLTTTQERSYPVLE